MILHNISHYLLILLHKNISIKIHIKMLYQSKNFYSFIYNIYNIHILELPLHITNQQYKIHYHLFIQYLFFIIFH